MLRGLQRYMSGKSQHIAARGLNVRLRASAAAAVKRSLSSRASSLHVQSTNNHGKKQPNEKPHAIILAGPKTQPTQIAAYQMCRRSGLETVQIGDGNKPLRYEDVDIRLLSHIASSPAHSLLFILAHGGMAGNQHVIELFNNEVTGISDFFSTINKARNPVNVISIACKSAEAVVDMKASLPNGSSYIGLSNRLQYTYAHNVIYAMDCATNFSNSEQLLLSFLSQPGLKSSSPCLGFFSNTNNLTISLERELSNRIGKKFTDNEKRVIHRDLGHLISKDLLDIFIDKIEKAKTLTVDLIIPFPGNYGRMLAIAYVVKRESLKRDPALAEHSFFSRSTKPSNSGKVNAVRLPKPGQ